jgi:hypothetical protein
MKGRMIDENIVYRGQSENGVSDRHRFNEPRLTMASSPISVGANHFSMLGV